MGISRLEPGFEILGARSRLHDFEARVSKCRSPSFGPIGPNLGKVLILGGFAKSVADISEKWRNTTKSCEICKSAEFSVISCAEVHIQKTNGEIAGSLPWLKSIHGEYVYNSRNPWFASGE